MKDRAPLVLAMAAAVLAVAGTLLVVHPPGARRHPTPRPPAANIPAAPPISRTAPPVSPSGPVARAEEPDAPPSRKKMSASSLQKGLEATWPGNLPADQKKRLVALGWAVIRADLTGQGRNKWPAYFPYGASRTGYTNVRMLAGVARTLPSRTALTQVIVIWTANDPRDRGVRQDETMICLAWDGARWQPRIATTCTSA